MTVAQSDRFEFYNGNGVTTSFGCPWYLESSADLDVYVGVVGQTGVLKSLNVDYTLSGTIPGGKISVIITPALAEGQVVCLTTSTPQNQPINFSKAGSNYLQSIERALDKLTRVSQELSSRIERTLRINDAELTDQLNVMPVATERAGKIFTFDEDGNPSVADVDLEGIEESAAAAITAAAAAVAAAELAQSTLDGKAGLAEANTFTEPQTIEDDYAQLIMDGVTGAEISFKYNGVVNGYFGSWDPNLVLYQAVTGKSHVWQVDGGNLEAMRLNPVGALGFGGENFGNSGNILKSNGDTDTPEWVPHFVWGPNYFVNSETIDQLATINEVIALFNADDFGVVVFPDGWHIAYSATPNTITGSKWGLFCAGRSYLHLLDTAGATGKHFQLGDDLTDTSANDILIAGFEFANENWRTETGTSHQIECRVVARVTIQNCTTDNGLVLQLGYAGGFAANSVKVFDIVTTANSGLPGAVLDVIHAPALVIDGFNCDADGRNIIRNPNFSSSTVWVAGAGWTYNDPNVDPLIGQDDKAVKAIGMLGNLVQPASIIHDDQKAVAVPGETYSFIVDLDSISGGTLTVEMVGDTTNASAAFSTVGDNTVTVVCPANLTSIRIVPSASGVACVIDDIIASRAVHDDYCPIQLFPRDSGGNIDGMHLNRFIANGELEKHCMVVNYSFGEIGNFFCSNSFFELSSDSPIKIHSPDGTTGFFRNFQYNGGRISSKLASTVPAVDVNTGTSVTPVAGQFNNVDFLGGQAEFVKVTTTNVDDPVAIAVNHS